MPEEYLTVKEIAGLLRVSKMTVYRMVEDGSLPSIRVGRSIRVPSRSLDVYLNQNH